MSMQQKSFSQIEKELIETITSQRGCLIENHYAMKATLEIIKTPITADRRETIVKLLSKVVRSTKKELCESKNLSQLYDSEEGRLGI